jgi:hypothetical protein
VNKLEKERIANGCDLAIFNAAEDARRLGLHKIAMRLMSCRYEVRKLMSASDRKRTE